MHFLKDLISLDTFKFCNIFLFNNAFKSYKYLFSQYDDVILRPNFYPTLLNQVLKQKLKREHHLKGTLPKQSNKHQKSQMTMLKAEKISFG